MWDQSAKLQIQETSFIPIEEQDHFLSYHGPESMILDPQMELFLKNDQNLVDIYKEQICFETDSTSKSFDYQQHAVENYFNINSDHGGNVMDQFGCINNNMDMDDTNYNVMDYMEYDGICSVYQPRFYNGGVVIQEPNSWLPAQDNTNYQEHVLLSDQKMEQYGTLEGDQNYKP